MRKPSGNSKQYTDIERVNVFHSQIGVLIRLHGDPFRESLHLSRNVLDVFRRHDSDSPKIESIADEIGFRSFMMAFRHLRAQKSPIRLPLVIDSARQLSGDEYYRALLDSFRSTLQSIEKHAFPKIGYKSGKKQVKQESQFDVLLFGGRQFHLDMEKIEFLERLGPDLEKSLTNLTLAGAQFVFMLAALLDDVIQHRDDSAWLEFMKQSLDEKGWFDVLVPNRSVPQE